MADGALFIRNGAKKFNTEINTLLCKFHFWQAIHPKIYKKDLIPDSAIRSEDFPVKFRENLLITNDSTTKTEGSNLREIVKFDIRILEILPNKDLYITFLKIIIPFWKTYATNFYEYFWKTYLDPNNSNSLSGWQNFIKQSQPGTNNALEGLNHALKDFVTEHQSLAFGPYVAALCKELADRSAASSLIANFPQKPTISISISRFAVRLHDKFQRYFLFHNNNYYIKERFVNSSLYNKKSGKIKKEISALAIKIYKNKEEALTRFYGYYTKPSVSEINP